MFGKIEVHKKDKTLLILPSFEAIAKIPFYGSDSGSP